MKCKICNSLVEFLFKEKILNKYIISYFQCPQCKLMHTEEPFWLEEAYQKPINIYDTGVMSRNIRFSKITARMIYFLLNKNEQFFDYAGGHGLFVRMMRDKGFDFYWDDKFCQNIFACGFEVEEQKKYELLTCFEVIEHVPEPLKTFEMMAQISDNILFSTEVLPEPIPKGKEWYYYGFLHGQHIQFYSIKTLKYIADYFKYNLYSNGGSLHFLSKKKLSSMGVKLLLQRFCFPLDGYLQCRMRSLTKSDSESLENKFCV